MSYMEAKPRLFILIPSLRMGGAENVVINFLKLLDPHKYDVHLVVALDTGPLISEVPDYVRVSGLTKNELLIRVANYSYAKFGCRFLIRFLLRKLKGHYRAALCFQDSVFTDYLTLGRLTFDKSLSIVQSNYSTYPEKSKHFKGRHKQRILERYKKLDTIVAVSQTVKEGFEQLFGTHSKIRIANNPINLKKVIELSGAELILKLQKDRVNFIAIGRLVPVKGFDNLIKAAAILKKKGLPFQINIVGSGPLKEELGALISEFELEGNVTLLGFIENPYPIIKHSDVYIMTSYSEGLPTALCEAMYLGLPVVVTNVTGCQEVVDYGKYGVMAEPEPKSIADGMEKLILSKESRNEYSRLSEIRSLDYDDTRSMEFYYNFIDNP